MTDIDLVEQVAKMCSAGGLSVATAESLTGGQLAAALAAGPDSSHWFAGAVVAYSTQVKRRLLGVAPGPVVTGECAAQMARGGKDATGADVLVAVTGVGGPEPDEGQPAGTVWFATCGPGGSVHTERHLFGGDPQDVLAQTCTRALELLLELLQGASH